MNETGEELVQVPSVVESVWPACAVPVATGSTVFTGGSDCTIVGVGFEDATLIPFGPVAVSW